MTIIMRKGHAIGGVSFFLCSKIRSKKSDDNSDFFYGLFPKIHFFKNHVKSMILTRDTTAKSQRNCEIVFIDFFKIEW